MKKLSLMMLGMGTALIIQSCMGGGNKTSTEKADSSNTAKMSDSAKTPAITVDKGDAEFAVKAANGGMAEVALGKLAQTKATNSKIKAFAEMMVTDHSKANAELMALAKSKNITLPATVTSDKQKEMDELGKKTGADFDKAYVDAMIDGHKKTISLFEDESKTAKDPDIKTFVDKTLPTIKMHLQHIQAIHDSMK
jgi:putative membrane protein